MAHGADGITGEVTSWFLEARRGAWWDANKIGLSPPPIETEKGWLFLYHGVRQTAGGCLYRLGLALFGLQSPEKLILRGDSWVFGPEATYERVGDVRDVVFPCGYTVDRDGDSINLYYGGRLLYCARSEGVFVRCSPGWR